MESHNDKMNSIRKLSAAYKSMYEPKPEPEVNTEEEIETQSEEDTNVTTA